MIDISLCGYKLPHIFLDGAVLLVGGLFLGGELLPFGLERVHFGELRPGKDPLLDRKNLLSAVVNDTDRMAVSRFVLEHGIDLFNLTKNEGLEGVVASASTAYIIPVNP